MYKHGYVCHSGESHLISELLNARTRILRLGACDYLLYLLALTLSSLHQVKTISVALWVSLTWQEDTDRTYSRCDDESKVRHDGVVFQDSHEQEIGHLLAHKGEILLHIISSMWFFVNFAAYMCIGNKFHLVNIANLHTEMCSSSVVPDILRGITIMMNSLGLFLCAILISLSLSLSLFPSFPQVLYVDRRGLISVLLPTWYVKSLPWLLLVYRTEPRTLFRGAKLGSYIDYIFIYNIFI